MKWLTVPLITLFCVSSVQAREIPKDSCIVYYTHNKAFELEQMKIDVVAIIQSYAEQYNSSEDDIMSELVCASQIVVHIRSAARELENAGMYLSLTTSSDEENPRIRAISMLGLILCIKELVLISEGILNQITASNNPSIVTIGSKARELLLTEIKNISDSSPSDFRDVLVAEADSAFAKAQR